MIDSHGATETRTMTGTAMVDGDGNSNVTDGQ